MHSGIWFSFYRLITNTFASPVESTRWGKCFFKSRNNI